MYSRTEIKQDGSYAKVKSTYSERLKTNVAIKIINRKRAPPDCFEKFLPRELDILASLNHRNIVYMIMELGVQGDLLEFIKFRGALPEDFTRKLFKQLSLAIKFTHKGVKAEAESDPKPSVESKDAAGTSKHTKKK
uniref:non-specific serine/threonine protein kinase n=1 Tax=Oncorhynchus tshawytscha TaxID=74940 RepID=A0A8C8J2T3_ONCTS